MDSREGHLPLLIVGVHQTESSPGLVLPGPRPTDILAIMFGIGAAVVLDEFALIPRLADVYWQPEGRESIDAVILAGGIAILYLLGLGFWPHLVQELARMTR